MHRSVFLNIAHGQTIENTKYVDILETTCSKNHRFDSFSSKILSKLFSILCAKTLFLEINSNQCTYIKTERRRMINQTDREQK